MSKVTEEVAELIARVVPIKEIRVEEQHRRNFDEKKIKDLAGSISKVGVLQPLLVRSVPPSKGLLLELVAGERRLRAAKLAGLHEVPVRVGSWSDQEAAEIQAFENLHRQDLTPIEEARAFDTLLKAGGYDVKALAERVDKSEAYVYRAIKLLEIPAKIQDEIEDGMLTPAHGRILLRAIGKTRDQIADWLLRSIKQNGEAPTVNDTWQQIEQTAGRDLAKAFFPKDVAYAGQPACSGCPLNSGNQKDLFDGVEKGHCTGPGCYDAKKAQEIKDFQAKQAQKHAGIEYVGTVEDEYRLTGKVLTSEDLKNPKVKALIAEKPSKFTWAVVADRWSPRKAVILAKSPATIRALEPKSKSYESYSSPRQTPKDKFVEAAVEMALIKAAGALCLKMPQDILMRDVVLDGSEEWKSGRVNEAYEALGLERSKGDKDLTKNFTVEQLSRIAWMLTISDSMRCDEGPNRLKKLGVDIAKVKKDAKAAALGEWALRSAGAKDAKRAGTGATKEDNDAGEDEDKE